MTAFHFDYRSPKECRLSIFCYTDALVGPTAHPLVENILKSLVCLPELCLSCVPSARSSGKEGRLSKHWEVYCEPGGGKHCSGVCG